MNFFILLKTFIVYVKRFWINIYNYIITSYKKTKLYYILKNQNLTVDMGKKNKLSLIIVNKTLFYWKVSENLFILFNILMFYYQCINLCYSPITLLNHQILLWLVINLFIISICCYKLVKSSQKCETISLKFENH